MDRPFDWASDNGATELDHYIRQFAEWVSRGDFECAECMLEDAFFLAGF